MEKFASAALLAAALLLVPACATEYGYGGGYYDGYYDNYYGSVYDGYWGPDAYFYYRTAPGAVFVRDDARHFRHERGTGFQHFRYQHHEGMPDGDRDHDRDHRHS
ncbi:MAG: hypothetical protein WAU68_15000 [Vitreimonas sp.]